MMSDQPTEPSRAAEHDADSSAAGFVRISDILPSVLAAIQAQAAQLQRDRPIGPEDREYRRAA